MEDLQKARFKMINGVLSFVNLSTSTALTSTLPIYGTLTGDLQTVANGINTQLTKGDVDITDLADKKTAAENQVIADVEQFSAVLRVASGRGEIVLEGQPTYTRSQLVVLGEAVLPGKASDLYTFGNTLVNSPAVPPATGTVNLLVNYGIDAAKITAYQGNVTKYTGAISNIETGKSQKKSADNALKPLFKKASTTLKNLDKVSLFFKNAGTDAATDFYNQYKQSRKTDDPATEHTKVKGVITDATTGNPIAGVKVAVTITKTKKVKGVKTQVTEPFSTTSGADGSYSLAVPMYGAVSVEYTAAGYRLTQTTVELVKGEATPKNISMTAGS